MGSQAVSITNKRIVVSVAPQRFAVIVPVKALRDRFTQPLRDRSGQFLLVR